MVQNLPLEYSYSNMEINHLKILQTLVADPNLSRAAERLKITQSALSKRLQSMELEIGASLFERRGPRGLRPYTQAVELAQLADRIVSAWDMGVKRVKRAAAEPTHFVLVGPQLFLREIVMPWWHQVATEFPELSLEIQVSPLARVSLETVQAGADAGILEHREELVDFVCKPIFTEKWGIVRNIGTKHKDLSLYKWGTYSTTNNPVDTWLVRRQKMVPPSYRIYWQDLTALAIWVADTPGAATVLPWHAAAWLVKRNRLAFDPLDGESTTQLYLAYPAQHPARRLLQSLGEIAKSIPQGPDASV